jgi:hypothetical protein
VVLVGVDDHVALQHLRHGPVAGGALQLQEAVRVRARVLALALVRSTVAADPRQGHDRSSLRCTGFAATAGRHSIGMMTCRAEIDVLHRWHRSRQRSFGKGRFAMSSDDGLEQLSSEQLHDLAVRRAKRHLDVRFFYQLMNLLPVAEAGAGEVGKSETDVLRLSAHVDDVADAGRGEIGELMRPFYLEYLRKHHVKAG